MKVSARRVSSAQRDHPSNPRLFPFFFSPIQPVSAIVFDIGSHTTRAGYAGEDSPKCVIPTAHGYLDVDAPTPANEEGKDAIMKDETKPQQTGRVRKYFVGEDGANVWRAGMEVGSLMADGIGS